MNQWISVVQMMAILFCFGIYVLKKIIFSFIFIKIIQFTFPKIIFLYVFEKKSCNG